MTAVSAHQLFQTRDCVTVGCPYEAEGADGLCRHCRHTSRTMRTRHKRVATPKARFLREVRRNAGMSIAQLESRSGISRAYLSRIEAGLSVPTGRQEHAIAAALGLDPAQLRVRAFLVVEEPDL